jgi:hypothetical protein
MSTTAIDPLLKPNWPYQNAEAVMLPYSERHTDIFPETLLPTLYFRWKEENLLDTIFPGMEINHLNRFVSYWGDPRRIGRVLCCLKNPVGVPKVVGMGWLCEYECRRASFGFGFFREVWGKRVHVDLSMMMLHNWFYQCDVEILYGTTLNPVAKNYSKRFGFQYLTQLPKFFPRLGVLHNAHLIALERGLFAEYYRVWQAKRG